MIRNILNVDKVKPVWFSLIKLLTYSNKLHALYTIFPFFFFFFTLIAILKTHMPQDNLENWQISWPYLNKLAVVRGRLRWSMTSFGQLRSLNFVVWSCATAAWSPSTPSAPRQRSEDRKVFGSWTCETEGINDLSVSINKRTIEQYFSN